MFNSKGLTDFTSLFSPSNLFKEDETILQHFQ